MDNPIILDIIKSTQFKSWLDGHDKKVKKELLDTIENLFNQDGVLFLEDFNKLRMEITK